MAWTTAQRRLRATAGDAELVCELWTSHATLGIELFSELLGLHQGRLVIALKSVDLYLRFPGCGCQKLVCCCDGASLDGILDLLAKIRTDLILRDRCRGRRFRLRSLDSHATGEQQRRHQYRQNARQSFRHAKNLGDRPISS